MTKFQFCNWFKTSLFIKISSFCNTVIKNKNKIQLSIVIILEVMKKYK